MQPLSSSEYSCKVSIVLPVFNGGKTLAVAINSILVQSFGAWELIVIDDASNDNSVSIVKAFKDPRIRLIESIRNEGLAAKLNQGILLSRGQYFARMDQDDIAYPERIEKQVAFLEANSNTDLLGTRTIVFTSEGDAIGLSPLCITHAEICARPWSGFYLPHPSWMGRLSWFRANLYYQPEVVRGEDQELLLRTYHRSVFACLPEVLLAYRLNSVTWKNSVTARLNLLPRFWKIHWENNRFLYAFVSFLLIFVKLFIEFLVMKLGFRNWLRSTRTRALDADTVEKWKEVWKASLNHELN